MPLRCRYAVGLAASRPHCSLLPRVCRLSVGVEIIETPNYVLHVPSPTTSNAITALGRAWEGEAAGSSSKSCSQGAASSKSGLKSAAGSGRLRSCGRDFGRRARGRRAGAFMVGCGLVVRLSRGCQVDFPSVCPTCVSRPRCLFTGDRCGPGVFERFRNYILSNNCIGF
jgi:hypothetical protein